MQWKEVNFALLEGHIHETKNGDPPVISLAAPAIEILRERRQESQKLYVFPGKGQKGYLADPKKLGSVF
jgi:hypothetical protein